MHTKLFHAALIGTLLSTGFGSGLAMAQTNPSAQQLINQLTPGGTLNETTRGIKPLPPSGGAAPTASTAPAGGPVRQAVSVPATPSANLNIEFASGSAALTPQATAALDQLGKALTSTSLAAYKFRIVGHTDTTGNADANQTLSEQRAAAVKSYLETKFGVSGARLQSEGVGESDPLVQTPPNTPNMRNRRVQIINLGA